MTTDITELAQREEFEAWAEEAGALPWGILGKHRKQDGNYPGPHYTYMWKAWQAASAELVEALEKSEKTSEARREAIDRTHNMFVRERDRANAAEEALEKAQAKNALVAGGIEAATKLHERIAELESRTVKLPQAVSAGGQGYQEQVERILTAAGIKWEAE